VRWFDSTRGRYVRHLLLLRAVSGRVRPWVVFDRVVAGAAHYAVPNRAGVAELADAPGLGPGGLRLLEVRLLSPALS
jgi:hypothetical protein